MRFVLYCFGASLPGLALALISLGIFRPRTLGTFNPTALIPILGFGLLSLLGSPRTGTDIAIYMISSGIAYTASWLLWAKVMARPKQKDEPKITTLNLSDHRPEKDSWPKS